MTQYWKSRCEKVAARATYVRSRLTEILVWLPQPPGGVAER